MNKDQIRARDAEGLLANPVFKGFLVRMSASLDAQMMGMDVIDKDRCAKIILAKQILIGMEREIHRYISEGEIQDLVETRKKNPLKAVFQR